MENDLPLGAHITSPRRGFVHHGIYVGNGRVIHYAGLKGLLHRGPVEEVSLEEFARDHGFVVKPWSAPRYTAAERVARARSRLGENSYRLLSNNCEHFVAWCFSGAARSEQVQTWRARMQAAVFAGVWVVGGAASAAATALQFAI
jgi:hypothetical protein